MYRDSFDGFAKTLHSGINGSEHLVHYFHDVVVDSASRFSSLSDPDPAQSSQVMERDGSPVVAGQAAPKELAAELKAVAEALRPAQRLQPCLATLGGRAMNK